MSTGPSRTIVYPTKLIYIRTEGHIEETGLLYCLAVDRFSKTNQISRRTSEP